MLSPVLTLNCSCDEALQRSSQSLAQAGLRVIQTFDLHMARHTLEDCLCPHHGTSACDCQMLVLLVYGDAAEPATLILHGNDGHTSLSIVDSPDQKTNSLTLTAIKRTLEEKPPLQTVNRVTPIHP